MMTFFKNIPKLTVAVVFIALLAQAVKADYRLPYLESNQDLWTLQVNEDPGLISKGVPLHEVFNSVFANAFGFTPFNSTAELLDYYRDRDGQTGQHLSTSGQWFAYENARIYSVYQSSSFDLKLSFDFGGGEVTEFIFPAIWTDKDPVWGDYKGNSEVIFTGAFTMAMYVKNMGVDYPDSADWEDFGGHDNLIHMIAFNVTDLITDVENLESAWLFAWEETHGRHSNVDFSYQDLVQIFINVRPDNPPVPEPATVLILLGGLGALPLARRFRKK